MVFCRLLSHDEPTPGAQSLPPPPRRAVRSAIAAGAGKEGLATAGCVGGGATGGMGQPGLGKMGEF